MKQTVNRFAEEYGSALEGCLWAGKREAALNQAYEMGRKALAEGVGPLEIVSSHHKTLREILSRLRAEEERDRFLREAELFLLEAFSSFEAVNLRVQETNQALRHLNELLEKETHRIAHALHDQTAQSLVLVHLELSQIEKGLSPGRESLRKVRKLLWDVEDQLRRLSHELRPVVLDDFGLKPALDFLAQGVAERMKLSVQVKGETEGRLPQKVETVLYRIVQESLANVSRHARATRVFIELQRSGTGIRCTIRDDGVGFDVAATLGKGGKRGLGLLGMRERLAALGGKLDIASDCGQGTRVVADLPLDSVPDPSRRKQEV